MTIQITISHPDGSNEQLLMQSPARLLENRRASGMVARDGDAVFVKAFFQPTRARFHAAREARRTRQLRRHGLPAPQILDELEGTIVGPNLPETKAQFVVFEQLSPGTTLADTLASTETPRKVLQDAWTLMCDLESSGFIHSDPHLSNFIYCNEELYLVDCGAIRRPIIPTRWLRKPNTLPIFLAQFDPQHNEDLKSISGYDWRIVEAKRVNARDSFMRKMLRDCSRIQAIDDLLITRHLNNDELMGLIQGNTSAADGIRQFTFSDSATAHRAWSTAHYLGRRIANISIPAALKGDTIFWIEPSKCQDASPTMEVDEKSLARRLADFRVSTSPEEIRDMAMASPDGPRLDRCDQLRFD